MGATMKKTIYSLLVVAGLILASSLPAYARYGHGGWHGHGGHFSGSIWIGPGWGPWWGPPNPFYTYPYYPYPYYATPPVVIQQSPQEYIQQPAPQSDESGYWYYCPDRKGYYPYVKKCPNGWLKVVPSPGSPDERGE